MKHFNIRIFGKVQGVFFRATAKEEAGNLNIKGFAQNLPDGSLYIEAEGKKENLEKFIKWCHTGPTLAQVKKVEAYESHLKDFPHFEVL